MAKGPKKKKESNAERTARLLQAEKLGRGGSPESQLDEIRKRARRRASVYGGAETGATAKARMGAA